MSNLIHRIITSIILSIFFVLAFYMPPFIISLTLGITTCIILITEWPRLFSVHSLAFWLIMPLYPILPVIYMITLNHDPVYRPLLALLVISIASHDTGAYIVGNLIGRHKICPQISPGKTWEGFLGGTLATTCALGVITYFYGHSASWSIIITASCMLSVAALAGDLFESALKRRAGIKDSGSLLPGHGGLLDRFDGILFGAYLMYICRTFFILLCQ